jgi:hypothetical protein
MMPSRAAPLQTPLGSISPSGLVVLAAGFVEPVVYSYYLEGARVPISAIAVGSPFVGVLFAIPLKSAAISEKPLKFAVACHSTERVAPLLGTRSGVGRRARPALLRILPARRLRFLHQNSGGNRSLRRAKDLSLHTVEHTT